MQKTVVLLRHAEEPPESEGSPDLAKAGRRRADRLTKYVLETFGKPDFLFAAQPSGNSVRAYLTLRPLADATGLIIQGDYKSDDSAQLAGKLLYDPRFNSALIVVAWTHKELPTLASALGVASKDFPDEWDVKVFNLCYRLTWSKGRLPKVRRYQQSA